MKVIPLSQVVEINPRLPKGLEDSREVSFVPMAAVSEDGGIDLQETRNYGEVRKGFTNFQRGDVLLAKITPCFENGKSALADNLEHPIGFGSTEFHVLRAIPGKSDPRFLYHVVRSKQLLSLGQKSMKGAAGHKRVPAEFLVNFEIPDWSLDDQIRIAHLLGKVEGLIAQRKQHLQQLNDLLKSVFLEMFGDPVKNEKRWEKPEFSAVISNMRNGLSPSKAGTQKGLVYSLSAITGESFQEIYKEDIFSQIHQKYFPTPNDFLLCRGNGNQSLVGKGYFFPSAQASAGAIFPDTIIAASIQPGAINKSFLEALWKTKFIRQQIENNARTTNGAHKINQGVIENIEIIRPPIDLQNQFSATFEKAEGIKSRYQQSLTDLEGLYGALSQQAFKGELDLSRVALPAAPIEGESPVAAAVPAPITTPVIELPETELLLPALRDSTQLAPLLRFWLEAYRTQLGSAAFSLERFIVAAQTRVGELHPDNDFELRTSDYASIKTWVFDSLAAGALTQTFDDDGNRIELKAMQA